NVSVWARTVVIAALIAVSEVVMLLLSRNPVPEAAERPRPLELKFTPLMVSELVDLRQDVVVVALQRGAGGRNRRDGVVGRGAGGDAECQRLRIRNDRERGGVGI